jgi:hypothetical protein
MRVRERDAGATWSLAASCAWSWKPLLDAAGLVTGGGAPLAGCRVVCVLVGVFPGLTLIPVAPILYIGWSVYAQPDHVNNSSRLTFKSPSGNKLKSLKEVQTFLSETANGDRVPKPGAVVEAEMVDQHEENKTEWVQGTIIKMLPKTNSFKVEFKVENAEEKGAWQETYKVFVFLPCFSVFCSARRRCPSFSILQPSARHSHYTNVSAVRGGHRVALAAADDRGVQGERPSGY